MTVWTVLIGVIALVVMGYGFWKEDLVAWLIDTIIWLIWAYMAYNYGEGAFPDNTYMGTALAILGGAFVLLGIYKDFSCISKLLKDRRGPPPMSYDEEKEANRRHIYDITRRR
jgi:hypothetical protein